MAGTGVFSPGRAQIDARTLRRDRWWLQPLITVVVLVSFIVYSTIRAFINTAYVQEQSHLLSPFYSPCLAERCKVGSDDFGTPIGHWWALSPALLILVVPLGFRLTCYYYRKAYYRSFWQSPPACAVAEPHAKYTGETRFPLIGQNVHRYFFYLGLLFNVVLTWDAIHSFKQEHGLAHAHGGAGWGHMGLGTLVLIANACLLWLYSLSCHSCRHAMGGRLNHFSKHPIRYWAWTQVSKLNTRHMQLAWVSLFGVALTDAYVSLVASGAFHDPRFF
ncbi:MAG TPA: hypothetical protein VHU88_17895 [Sporichthyaceae bacterium]|jgi:hypothetical protein|nr:hypothetical protein [Sporichthyaceae bacterium]